jgi:hypothetical protein
MSSHKNGIMDESINNKHERVLEDNNSGDDGTTESTSSTSGDDDDDNRSTTGSDNALCDILGLPSLSEMVMVVDEEDGEEEENPCGESMIIPTPIPIPTQSRMKMISRRIELPSTRGVSRKYHPSEDCFAYEIQNVLSPDECSRLIEIAANSNSSSSKSKSRSNNSSDSKSNSNNRRQPPSSSSFRYITHAVHTAPDGETKFDVKLERPNPHKLAVFRHESWVTTLWDRLEPVLFERDDHRNARNVNSAATTTPTGRNWQNVEIDENDVDNNNNNDNGSSIDSNCSMPLPEALNFFIRRESLSASASPTKASPIAGLNPRLRVLKYDASDRDEFQGHFDATTEIHSSVLGQTSYMTVLLYLNDGGGGDFDGGETEFLSQERKEQQQASSSGSDFSDSENKNSKIGKDGARSDGFASIGAYGEKNGNNIKMVKITPKAGSVVLFEHDLFHRGRPLLWGTKYVLRTDIMFTNRPSCDAGDETKTEIMNEHEPQRSQGAKAETPNNDEATVVPSTVEDVLSRIEEEQKRQTTNKKQKHHSAALSLFLRNALSEGLGFGDDLQDTTIECLCSPGRFALNLMLREHMIPAVEGTLQQQRQQQQVDSYHHRQQTIDMFLDASFAALKDQPR